MGDQAVEERTRRRPGTGWRMAVRRMDAWAGGAGGDEDGTVRGGLLQRAFPAVGDLADPSPDATDAATTPPLAASTDASHVASDDAPDDAADGAADHAPDIDPRIRQRRLDVEAERDRHRTRLLMAATSALVAAAVCFGVLRSPLLDVRRPRVSGQVQTSAADVLRAAGLTGRPLMMDLSLGRSAAAIRRLPWIATARVRRSWPDTVIVTVTERVPTAVITGMLVDVSGRVLSVAPPFVALDRVAIDQGATAPPLPAPGGTIPEVYQPGVAVVAAIPPALAPHVSAVLVRPGGTVRLSLVGGASAILGDTTLLAQKLEAVLTIVTRVRIGQQAIDATVPSAPVLTPLTAAGTVSTHTGG